MELKLKLKTIHGHLSSHLPTTTTSVASAAPPGRSRRRTQNPKPLTSKTHLFPESLPLHTKNPHIIHRTLQDLARKNRLKESLTILDYLEHRGIPVNPTTLSALLASCARRKALNHGRQIHVHVRINGLESNEFVLAKLVHMYCSCGSQEEAFSLLLKAKQRNFFAWNAMLKACMTSGPRWDLSPVRIFSQMRENGVAFNEYTMSCLIKSFAGSPAPRLGMQAHALLIKNCFNSHPNMLRTCMVDMYFKCRKIHHAMKLFNEIPEKDVVLWSIVISGFSHKGLKREAVKYFRFMLQDGIEPNSIVLSAILAVIGDISSRNLGREIHAYALKRYTKYDKLIFVQSSLVDMYCKCKDILYARRVFYGCEERNVVMWTSLLSGYALNARPDMALKSVSWMQKEGFQPDIVVIGTILPICTDLKALPQGKEIHAYSLKRWFLTSVSISNCLISLYGNCGRVDYARKVFDEMKWKSVVVWTALIDSCIKNGFLYDGFDLFRMMVRDDKRPDSIAICRIMRIAGDLREVKIGKELHAFAMKARMEENHFVCGELIGMYGKFGDVNNARKLFDGIKSTGSLTCTAIIEAYGMNKRYKEALDLFDLLLSDGFVPNNYSFDLVLGICEKGELCFEAVRVFDCFVGDFGLKASKENCECVIRLLDKAGRNDEAQRFVYLKEYEMMVVR
ncbi:hypothetical protein LUZ60_005501 [Juncus effusus]|nr:hypothetical protein LUZ60_005501 [Juncus effusus]